MKNSEKELHWEENLLTQEMDSDHWKFQVWTLSKNNTRDSPPATLNITHSKQKGREKMDGYFMLIVFNAALMYFSADAYM